MQGRRPSSAPADSPGQQRSHSSIQGILCLFLFLPSGTSSTSLFPSSWEVWEISGYLDGAPRGVSSRRCSGGPVCDPSKETRDGKGSGQLGKATRTGHQAFLEGRCGVVRWVAGNGRGVCWGGMSSVLCRDDRLLTPDLQRRAGGWSWPCSHSLTIKINASEIGG